MKKIKKISSNDIKNIIKDQILEDTFLPEHKIDSIIKEYLYERESLMDDTVLEDDLEFSPKTNEAISDMVDGLSEMVADLDIIKEKEGNVLLFQDGYADEYLEDVIQDLESVIGNLEFITELKDNSKDYDESDIDNV